MTKTIALRFALGLLSVSALVGSVALSRAQAAAPAESTGQPSEQSATQQQSMPPAMGNSLIARSGSGQTRLTARGIVQDGRIVHMTRPVYPAAAKQAQVSGVVTVEARVGKDGRVVATCVLKGPYPLRRVAEDAVKHWQYEPTLLNGEPVERVALANLSFVLGRYTDLTTE
jgi:TonB family protein